MNNNLRDTYCSYNVCKLLRDKGFDVWCDASYTYYLKKANFHKKGELEFEERGFIKGRNSNHNPLNSEYYDIVSAPTQALAIEWIRLNFNLHFELIWDVDKKLYWFVSITEIGDVRINAKPTDMPRKKHYTPEDAINYALEYTLSNLIVNIAIS